MGQGPCTLAPGASPSFVFREMTERATIVLVLSSWRYSLAVDVNIRTTVEIKLYGSAACGVVADRAMAN